MMPKSFCFSAFLCCRIRTYSTKTTIEDRKGFKSFYIKHFPIEKRNQNLLPFFAGKSIYKITNIEIFNNT